MTRLIVFTSAFAIAASAAMAGDSVLFFKSEPTEGRSVLTFTCDDCPEIKPSFVAPEVHGVEVLEHDVDGEKRIVQHDNMMGGSAVRIVKGVSSQDNYAGQTVTRMGNGTLVTSGGGPVVETVDGDREPVVADSNVTVSGGGGMNVKEINGDGVDGRSQTSSVESINMNDAQHENVGPAEPETERPHNDGPEIIDLRD